MQPPMSCNMPHRSFFILLFLLTGFTVAAQLYPVKGKVRTAQGEPIPFATLQVKAQNAGTITLEDGSFELSVPTGSYRLVVSRVGFRTTEQSLTVRDSIHSLIITLDEEATSLSEVVVRAKLRDRAEEIMRQVIRRKDSIRSAAGAYSFKAYTKAVLLDSGSRSAEANLTMAEIVSGIDTDGKGKIKEQRLAVRGSHNSKRLFYLSVTEGDFSLFNNLVSVPALSPTPFVSPVSRSGLLAYQFRTIKTKRSGRYRLYTFSVKPLGVTNATVEGEITVSDSAWTVLHARYSFPGYHMQEYDFFEVEQDFGFVQDQAWMLTRQQLRYRTRGARKVSNGQTTTVYSDFQLNRHFAQRHFGAELSSTTEEAYERDSGWWSGARTESLNRREAARVQEDFRIQEYTKTERFLDSIDRAVNRVTWLKLGFFGQSFRDHKKEQVLHLAPLTSFIQPFAFGGLRLRLSANFSKTFPSRKYIDLTTDVSYGFRNNDVNGSIDFYRRYNPFNRGFYTFSAGRAFAFINEGDAWINMIQRNNFYLNQYLGAGYGIEIANGLVVSTNIQVAFRQSVEGYKTGKLADSLLVGYVGENNQPIAFESYRALYGKWKLQYTPGQQYRREPKEKVILGSRWPTFYVQWEKGIPEVASSDVDFDYLEFGLEQVLKLGLAGVSRYSIRTGDFLNQKNLKFIDFKFQRRGDPFLFMNPNRSFQALDSTFAVFDRYVEAHFFHEFNGLFLNKIPLFKKLQLREVGGIGFLSAPERNLQYGELYLGVERSFQSPFNPLDRIKLGVYVVSSTANSFREPVQFKIGFTTWDKRKNRWF